MRSSHPCAAQVWFRFAQCLRKYQDVGDTSRRWIHFRNAAKYALSLFVTMFSALKISARTGALSIFRANPFWLAVFFASSCYSWSWDVFVDWGLVLYDPTTGRVFSRKNKLFPVDWWYKAAVLGDVFGRFVWLATVLPPSAESQRLDKIIPDYLVPLLALAELCRRCVWGFFRLEYEHVSNAFGNRREQQFVPSHFRRRAHSTAPPSYTPTWSSHSP